MKFDVGDKVIVKDFCKSIDYKSKPKPNHIYRVSFVIVSGWWNNNIGRWVPMIEGENCKSFVNPEHLELIEKKLTITNSIMNFKVGDNIVIKGEPSCWSSLLSSNKPLNANIQYPFHCVIDDLKEDVCYTAMSAGGYGWDLNDLINEGLVEKVGESWSNTPYGCVITANSDYGVSGGNGEINNNNNNNMKLNTMMKKLLDKDTKTLIEAGYINGDLELTEAGKKELMVILFLANKKELVDSAKELLEDNK